MNRDLIIIGGNRRVGKDTAADLICREFNFVKVAQADPMKRIAKLVLDCPYESLWGPSEMREKLVPWDSVAAMDRCDNIGLADLVVEVVERGEVKTKLLSTAAVNFIDFIQGLVKQLAGENSTDVSPRKFLQLLGTEGGRTVLGADVWSKYAISVAKELMSRRDVTYSPEEGLTGRLRYVTQPQGVVISDGRFGNEFGNVRGAGGAAIRVRRQSSVAATDPAGAHSSETSLESIPTKFFDAVVTNRFRGVKEFEADIRAAFRCVTETREF